MAEPAAHWDLPTEATPPTELPGGDPFAAPAESLAAPVEGIGLLAGRYRLVREIGRGGFGVVWLAEDTRLNRRRVAIKMLCEDIAADAGAVEAMRREAAIALDLTHPRIVRLHIFDVDGPHAFLVFEHLAGPTLSEILRARGTLTLPEALLVVQQTAEALAHIHQSGMVHCDVKPGNIMLDLPLDEPEPAPLTEETCQIKLTDLGISRALARAAEDGQPVMGTPTHMAPELLLGQLPSPASDVYALSCVLHQMLAGKPPFHGDDVVHQHLNSPPREIPGLPAAVNAVVLRGLAKRPQDRWASVGAMAMALRAAVEEAGEAPAPPPDPSTLEPLIEGPLGMPLALCPGGDFLMGSAEESPHHQPCEGPVHRVTLRPFHIGQFPVTVAEYEAFLWQTHHEPPHHWERQRRHPRRPVVYVSWEDAMAFCEWMARIGRRRYRLPTEAEWECAARGGLEGATHPWGEGDPAGKAVFNPELLMRDASDWDSVEANLTDVGRFDPNGFGLHDMAGLVAEWCLDAYQEDFYATSPECDPMGPGRGGRRVLRGGSWRMRAPHLRCAARLGVTPGSRCPDFGFRVVREV